MLRAGGLTRAAPPTIYALRAPSRLCVFVANAGPENAEQGVFTTPKLRLERQRRREANLAGSDAEEFVGVAGVVGARGLEVVGVEEVADVELHAPAELLV